jgi:phosphonate metabolism protein PhnN/1,5-bisphosphokinase (PRPP-forming)
MSLLARCSERLIVVVGASGAGKDSVLRAWLGGLLPREGPVLARRTITRPAGDPTEAHEAIDDAGFRAAETAGAFAVAWEAHGLRYGVRWDQLLPLQQGRWVVMNGSRAHLPALRSLAPAARVIEIAASTAVRSARLARREREDGWAAQQRLVRNAPVAGAELIVDNDAALNDAVEALQHWWREVSAVART